MAARFPHSEDGPAVLTPDQRRILSLLAAGASMDSTADQLGLDPEDLRCEMRRICVAAGTRTPAEAVTWATRNGLI